MQLVEIPEQWIPPKQLHLTAEEIDTLRVDFMPVRDERIACELKIHGHLLRLPVGYAKRAFGIAEE